MKELVNLATTKILKQDQLFIKKITPLTYIEYYKSDIFKKLIKLEKGTQKIYTLIEPLLFSEGFNCNDNIIIFLDVFHKPIALNQEYQLIDLLVCSLHEVGHSHQEQKKDQYTLFEQFCFDLEYFILENNPNHYNIYSAEYLQETLADIYGITKTELFLNNYPHLYEQNKEYILKLKKDYNLQKVTYDFYFIFEEFHKLNKNHNKLNVAIKQTDFLYIKNTNTFKPISEIINNWLEKWGKTSLYYILSSKEFINQLNFKNLTKEELKYLEEAIKHIYQIELEKKDYLDKILKTNKDNPILKKQTKLNNQVNRLKYLINILKLTQIPKIYINDTKPKSR